MILLPAAVEVVHSPVVEFLVFERLSVGGPQLVPDGA